MRLHCLSAFPLLAFLPSLIHLLDLLHLAEGRQGREVKVIESSGSSHTFAHPCKEENLPSTCLSAIQHFNFALSHCSRIESSLANLENPEQPAFPIIIGR